MAMTEEEKRIARNEASKRWYQAHKAKNKLASKNADAKQDDTDKIEKTVEKFVNKNEKVADAYRGLVKSAAEVLGDVFKSENDKLIAKTCREFGKKLSLEIHPMPEDGKAEITVSMGAKLFRIPKVKPAKILDETEADEKPAEKVVAVDPSLLTGIEDGSVTAADIDVEQDADRDDEDDEEKDPDDMDDDEYKEYLEQQADREAEAWVDGHADIMREMEEQGAYDDFEN